MSQKLHAADALLNHFSDSLHETHHQGHLTSKGIFEEGREDFLLSQKNGNKPNLSQQRAHLALEYVTCQPINSRFMRLGWYDKNARILHMAPDQDEELPDDPSLSDALIPDSPITTSLPPSTLPQADSPGTLATARQTPLPNSTSHKRKRILLDYIEIPAHKVKRPSRSPSSTIDSRSLSAPQESTSVQSVSDEPQMLSVGALDTQQTCVTMQVDLTCSPTITTEDAISMKDSSAAPDTELFTTSTIISPAIPHSTITDATTPVQSSNPNLRRKR
ncbi:hypothetical protein FPV67DRAFT_16037 [Lyophyllum atratum]|nr:hypothetical protein FPV67DRAFT_16037 [Lyophyllum atratum]